MIFVFHGLTIITCLYAMIRGGGPERVGASIIALALAGAWAAKLGTRHGFDVLDVTIFLQDIIVWIAFQAVALRADRFWPMWMAGLQLATVLVHVTRAMEPDIVPFAYALGLWCWAYLMLFALVIGTFRHCRRVENGGPDFDWTVDRQRARPA